MNKYSLTNRTTGLVVSFFPNTYSVIVQQYEKKLTGEGYTQVMEWEFPLDKGRSEYKRLLNKGFIIKA
jgi:hypothetical protein